MIVKRALDFQKSYVCITVLFFLTTMAIQAQLGFCSGNSGDPIFMETFGAGTDNGPPLPAGATTYTYVDGVPFDGSYTISSTTNYFDWFDTTDHTPGDTNGKALIVNASFTPGEFFRTTIDGLCENTSYEFSSWLINLHPNNGGCNFNGIPVNVRFQIWDNTDTNLLASGDTGDIFDKATPIWEQYALVFQTLPQQTSVILKMINNGAGGCGNDLGIDDIVFRTCGDAIGLTDDTNNTSIAICEVEAPFSTTLTANPDFSVYSSHAYQWQESADGTTWTDILGETDQSYSVSALDVTRFYRVKVAEDAINLDNDKCNAVSDIFQLNIVPLPQAPISAGDVGFCMDTVGGVSASVPSGFFVDWYDAPVGGNLLASGISVYETTVSGTYYAEAVSQVAGCSSQARTPVSITYFELPQVTDETLQFCQGGSITLNASVPNAEYLWSTGETSFQINADAPGDYEVLITDANGCTAMKQIQLAQIEVPIIDEVTSDHRDIHILTENTGDFEYSLDGSRFQDSATFANFRGGLYVAFVREKSGCGVQQLPFIHVVVPRFFSPNGDGINDNFQVEGFQTVNNFNIAIYNRFSRIMFESNDPGLIWDGTFNGRPMPDADYWYEIRLGENRFVGHFSLRR